MLHFYLNTGRCAVRLSPSWNLSRIKPNDSTVASARLLGLHYDRPSSLNSELLIWGIALRDSIPQGKEGTFWFKQRMHCLMNRSSIREPIDDPKETRAQLGISSNDPMQLLVIFCAQWLESFPYSIAATLSHQWDIKILAHIIISCTIWLAFMFQCNKNQLQVLSPWIRNIPLRIPSCVAYVSCVEMFVRSVAL